MGLLNKSTASLRTEGYKRKPGRKSVVIFWVELELEYIKLFCYTIPGIHTGTDSIVFI